MLKINPNTVTHIRLFPEVEGIYVNYWGLTKFKLVPEKKYPWWKFEYDVEAAYYPNGKYDRYTIIYTPEEVNENKGLFIKEDSVYTRDHIEIFAGKNLIRTEYFGDMETLENHLKQNYPHVNVSY